MTTMDWSSSGLMSGREGQLKATLNALPNGPCLIVEIGTSYTYSPLGLGSALLYFAWYAKKVGGRVLTFDPDENGIKGAKEMMVEQLPDCLEVVTFYPCDGLDCVKFCTVPISLLYLDAMDGEEVMNPLGVLDNKNNEWYVAMVQSVEPLLLTGAFILIDDYATKGKAVTPYLLGHGWRLATEIVSQENANMALFIKL